MRFAEHPQGILQLSQHTSAIITHQATCAEVSNKANYKSLRPASAQGMEARRGYGLGGRISEGSVLP